MAWESAMEEKKKRKQIAFDINPKIHQRVKILAAIRNISINLWIARAINDRIAKETKYDEKNSSTERPSL
jgi:predicted HicB family RNase H-like nuclease